MLDQLSIYWEKKKILKNQQDAKSKGISSQSLTLKFSNSNFNSDFIYRFKQ